MENAYTLFQASSLFPLSSTNQGFKFVFSGKALVENEWLKLTINLGVTFSGNYLVKFGEFDIYRCLVEMH